MGSLYLKKFLIKIFQYSRLPIFVLVLVVQQDYSAIYIFGFQVIFHCRLLQDTEWGSLCCAVNLCSVSVLCMAVCIC